MRASDGIGTVDIGTFGPAAATSGALPGSLQANSLPAGVPPIRRVQGDNVLVPGTATDTHPVTTFSDHLGMTNTAMVGNDMSLYDAKVDLFVQMATNPQAFMSMQQKLIDAGFLDPRSRTYKAGQMTVDDATFKAFDQAARFAIQTKKPISDLLNERAQQGLGAKYLSDSKTTTVHSSTVNLSDPTSVQALLADSMHRLLGRQPTPNELSGAITALHSMQQANPTQTDTTTTADNTYSPDGQLMTSTARDQSSTQSGGVDAGTVVDNYVQGHYGKEADAHGLNSYVDAFASMLGGG